ncbi:serine/threonine-protein kinase [Streptomyces roseolilacinus]|uniref:serine/threonine-protein kinase n=1 Tax=Streptomyces roseolilacinus TaxID=66904 RepID=UPI0037FD5FA2
MKVRPWLAQPDWRLTTHVVAGRYRLDDLLGRGGTAEVYKALDLRLRRPVAIKVFRPDGDGQPEERFGDEGRLLAQLQHPGLVTVYDSGQEDGRPYLVMQLVEGTTLRRRVAAGPLDPAEVCRIGAALASALAHVHAAHVVHRDVKPSNILLDGASTPYLTDFGISRLLDSTTHTAAGALVGTAAYVAPEQVLGRGAGPAADVYGLGLVLLECLKGEVEYPGAPLEAAIARLHRPPVIPSHLPDDLGGLLAAMTASDEESRPGASDCSRALTLAAQEAARAPSRYGNGAVGGGKETEGDTLRSASATARTGGAGPVAGVRPDEGPTASRPVPTPRSPLRADRAVLTVGAALAVLSATLTGSIGGLATDGEERASRPPRQAAVEPASPPADRPGPSPSPSPSPAAPAPDPAPRATPSATTESARQARSATVERPAPASPAAPAQYDPPRGRSDQSTQGDQDDQGVRSQGRDKDGLPPGQGKPPKKHKD